MSEEPSVYSGAWYRRQFQGVNHSLNRCLAEYQDCWEAVKSLRERAGVLESALQKAQEEIGRQTDEIAELNESMEKARKVFLELKQSRPVVG